jgi:hypothetical protein
MLIKGIMEGLAEELNDQGSAVDWLVDSSSMFPPHPPPPSVPWTPSGVGMMVVDDSAALEMRPGHADVSEYRSASTMSPLAVRTKHAPAPVNELVRVRAGLLVWTPKHAPGSRGGG